MEIPTCKTCSSSTNYLFQNAADGTKNGCGICKDGKPESTTATNTTRFEYNEQTGMCIDKCPDVNLNDFTFETENNSLAYWWKNETECPYIFGVSFTEKSCTSCSPSLPSGGPMMCHAGKEKEKVARRYSGTKVPFSKQFVVSPGEFAYIGYCRHNNGVRIGVSGYGAKPCQKWNCSKGPCKCEKK